MTPYATPKHIVVTKPTQPMFCSKCGLLSKHVYIGLNGWACVRCNEIVPGKAPEAKP